MFDLSIGEPEFLSDYLSLIEPDGQTYTDLETGHRIHSLSYFVSRIGTGYPTPGGEPELLHAIYDFEKSRAGERSGGPAKRIVVCNGATQGLAAALYAITERGRFPQCFCPTPYWSELPAIFRLLDIEFVWDEQEYRESLASYPVLGTLPNNPNGSMVNELGLTLDIWDAAYASPIYGWDGWEPPYRCKVMTSSKLFGCSGTRIGWLLLPEEYAHDAITYVQRTTAGVSRLSQAYLLGLLSNLSAMSGTPELVLAEKSAQALLLNNRKTVRELLCGDLGGGSIKHAADYSNRGMFAWLKPVDKDKFMAAAERAGVKLFDGKHFGDPDFVRMSLGRAFEYTLRACVVLRNELERA